MKKKIKRKRTAHIEYIDYYMMSRMNQ